MTFKFSEYPVRRIVRDGKSTSIRKHSIFRFTARTFHGICDKKFYSKLKSHVHKNVTSI